MARADFVHLRVHSAYSLSEGAIRIPELGELARDLSMPAVAITDRNNLFGALVFSETISALGVQPIIGCTLALAQASDHPDPFTLDWMVLLAQDDTGYRNLLKLVSNAHLKSAPTQAPHIGLESLAQCNAGLIALSGGPDGRIARHLLNNETDAARDHLLYMKQIFGDRYYLEIARHGVEFESATENATLDLAYELNVPIVATNQCFFARSEQYRAHDALICIAESTVVANPDRRRYNPEYRFKSPDEMHKLFADLPEAIENTLVIAERCAVKAETRAPILPNFVEGRDISEESLLRDQAGQGLKRRLSAMTEEQAQPYWQRLERELGIIIDMGFAGYFLIVADFIQWAKDQDIPVGPGRGSGAGSVVAWALRITDLDPLRFKLLFERFLNPERVSMPDFDIDFCQDRRDEVIRYVQKKYGRDQVAQIITFGKLQARAVLRDVGRVLEVARGEVDMLAKLVPNNPAQPVTLQQAIDNEPKLRQARRDREVKRLFDTALELEGLYRHTSTHAAGVVIGDRPLDQLVPLYRDPRSDMPVTQFDMIWVEKAGLVKFDFLGLKTLSVLKAAADLVAKRGIHVDPAAVPLDDPATFAMLSRGESFGVFQLESEGMRAVLTALKPDKLEDIIALVALYRPGPMDNIPSFINRKHKVEAIDSLHPMLEEILAETYGVIIYQEQVMQIAQEMAGYSLGEADLLRRAMGKKKKSEMDAQRARFVEGAQARGVDKEQASSIFDLVAKFAGYGFNKSHAAAYAVIAYQTAYFKANYPVEFLAASMTYDMHNTDKLAGFVFEARRMGIPVLPPDVNASQPVFSVEPVAVNDENTVMTSARGRGIRYALAAIKNVGESAMTRLVNEREASGPFKDLHDFGERLEPAILNKRLLENLIYSGALDSVNTNRAQSLAAVDTVLSASHEAYQRRSSQQNNLFDDAALKAVAPALTQASPWEALKALDYERQAVGFFLSAHPLDAYTKQLGQRKVTLAHLAIARFNRDQPMIVLMAGAIDDISERRTKSGRPFVTLKLTDQGGPYEVSFFDEQMENARRFAFDRVPVLMTVAIEQFPNSDRINLTGRHIQSLEEAAAQTSLKLQLYINDTAALTPLKRLLSEFEGGRGHVSLSLLLDEGRREVEIAVPGGHRITPQVQGRLDAMPGVVQALLH